jgi:hypothetical protein
VAIAKRHLDLYREAFAVPGLFGDPVLTLGFQIVLGEDLPEDFDYPDLKQLLHDRGIENVRTLDYFDPQADLRHDLNVPFPESEHERYATVVDLGTLEHIFDTRTCLESCLRAVKVGGHYFLVAPVKGYFQHGFHVFDPRALIQALGLNGFEIVHRRFSARSGQPLDQAWHDENVLIWLVGRKLAPIEEFRFPMERRWTNAYATTEPEGT